MGLYLIIGWVLIGSVGTLILGKRFDGYVSVKGLLFCLFFGSILGPFLPLMFLHHIGCEKGWFKHYITFTKDWFNKKIL